MTKPIPTFEDWLERQPRAVRLDPLWTHESYRLSAYLQRIVWDDCRRLVRHPVMVQIAPQLFRAVGSVPANIAEGFSRWSGRDRSRFYEYSLGSARETVTWYRSAEPVLGQELSHLRQEQMQHVVRLLLTSIPRERHRDHRRE